MKISKKNRIKENEDLIYTLLNLSSPKSPVNLNSIKVIVIFFFSSKSDNYCFSFSFFAIIYLWFEER